MNKENDTIVAISTKLGKSAISIIRVSGPDAISLVNQLFKKGKDLTKVPTHTIHYGYIYDNDQPIDEVLVTIMKAPKTFTREDVVEINCHGGLSTTLKIFEQLQLIGARVADPGEFTKRAYLNGRIDLTQAEAVMDLIESKSDQARKMALSSLEGNLKNYIINFRNQLKHVLANIEVNIDYPEYYDIAEVTYQEIKDLIANLQPKLQDLITRSEEMLTIKNGIKTVIVGRPNVGKSSILNALLNQDKAIVTDIEGTTRDIVEGNIIVDGIELNLIDTAGIRNTDNLVEKIGVEKSLSLLEDADLVIAVLNSSEPLIQEDETILQKLKENNKTTILVLNKNDLPQKLERNTLDFPNIVSTNTNSIEGIEPLKQQIKTLFSKEQLTEKDYTYLASTRQLTLAKKAYISLQQAKKSLIENQPIDIIEIDLKEVMDILGNIIGDSYDEQLLDELFANFCVGK